MPDLEQLHEDINHLRFDQVVSEVLILCIRKAINVSKGHLLVSRENAHANLRVTVLAEPLDRPPRRIMGESHDQPVSEAVLQRLFAPEDLKVLRAVGRQAVSGRVIARAVGMADRDGYPNSTLRVVLRLLNERGVLENTPDGHRLSPFTLGLLDHFPGLLSG